MQVPVESNMLHIDRESCRGDALCVNICPVSCLRMRDGKAAPVPLADRICLGCGQCMAVCPEHAISSGESGEEQISPLPAIPDFAACSALIRSRRSVRHYKKTPIPREILSAALDTACYAPTGKNRQDVKWIILDNASRVRELSAMVINAMRSMPHMARLVAAFDKGEDPVLRMLPVRYSPMRQALTLCAGQTAPLPSDIWIWSCTVRELAPAGPVLFWASLPPVRKSESSLNWMTTEPFMQGLCAATR